MSEGSVSPVSSSVLRLESTRGQPRPTIDATVLPGSNPSCTTVSFTSSPSGSMSKLTFDRGSAAIRSRASSVSSSDSASSGVKLCQL